MYVHHRLALNVEHLGEEGAKVCESVCTVAIPIKHGFLNLRSVDSLLLVHRLEIVCSTVCPLVLRLSLCRAYGLYGPIDTNFLLLKSATLDTVRSRC
jgi:hypothetical protein